MAVMALEWFRTRRPSLRQPGTSAILRGRGRPLVPRCPLLPADSPRWAAQELEDVANPVISAAYAASGEGGAGGAEEDLGDHDEL